MHAPVEEVVMQPSVTDTEQKILEHLSVVLQKVQAVEHIESMLLCEDKHVCNAFLHPVCSSYIIV